MMAPMDQETTRLRPIDENDLAATHRWRQDMRVVETSLGRRFPNTMVTEIEWYRSLDASPFPNRIYWAVEDADATFVGLAQLNDVNWIHRTASFGIWIIPDHWGRGHGRTATAEVLRRAGEVFGLRQVRLEVLAAHATAVKLYLSLGFVEEGCKRAAALVNGSHEDVLLMRYECGCRIETGQP